MAGRFEPHHNSNLTFVLYRFRTAHAHTMMLPELAHDSPKLQHSQNCAATALLMSLATALHSWHNCMQILPGTPCEAAS